MRNSFNLPEQDTDFLNAQSLDWETIRDRSLQFLLLHAFPLPTGYNIDNVEIAIMIPPGYPVASLDMVYFHPALSLKNDQLIKAVSLHLIDGRPFQRWSRHRSTQNPWRPGVDDISVHYSLINFWLEKEVKK